MTTRADGTGEYEQVRRIGLEARCSREAVAVSAVLLVCLVSAVVCLYTAVETGLFVLNARAASRLADPPRIGKLIPLAMIYLVAGGSLALAARRLWLGQSFHHRIVSQWSPLFTLIWASVFLFWLAVYYPLPYHAHHIDKLLIASGLSLVWSLLFLARPAWLAGFLNGRVYAWIKISLVNILVFLAVSETVFRMADPILARTGLFGSQENPARLTPHQDTLGSIGTTNSQGFRDRERTFERTSSAPRMIALGDSFTYGAGVSYDEIFTTVVERELQQVAPGLEMINLGVAGWAPAEELHLLEVYGSRFQPDLVLLNFFVGNDIMRRRGAFLEEPFVVAGRSYYVHSTGNWAHDTIGPDRWYVYHHVNYLFTVGASRLRRLANRTEESARDLGYWKPITARSSYLKDIDERSEIYLRGDTPLFDFHWNHTQSVLNRLQQFLHARGTPLMIILLPAHEQLDTDLQRELIAALGASPDRYDFEKPQRLLKSWGEQHGVLVVDLLSAFKQVADPMQLHFRNDIHWTRAGHTLAASALLPVLEQYLTNHPPRQ